MGQGRHANHANRQPSSARPHVPAARLARTRRRPGRLNHVIVLLVHVHTDAGLTGLGFAYALQGSGRALLALAEDDLTPLVCSARMRSTTSGLAAKVYWRLQTIGRRGLVQQAYSAFDVALWDLKGKAAGLPLYKLLGGARESAPVYGSDTAWLWMSPEEILDASRPYLDQGMMGIKVKVGADPEADADRLTQLREALGDDVWLAVDANERYDYATALAMGHFFEEEIGADWFEEPILCEDVAGHARLASKLEIPIAGGRDAVRPATSSRRYLERDAPGRGAAGRDAAGRHHGLAESRRRWPSAHHRPLSPHLLPEIGVHLACGLPSVTSVEYMPWLWRNNSLAKAKPCLFFPEPQFREGRLLPPPGPGLGLEVNPDVVAKYRVNGLT